MRSHGVGPAGNRPQTGDWARQEAGIIRIDALVRAIGRQSVLQVELNGPVTPLGSARCRSGSSGG